MNILTYDIDELAYNIRRRIRQVAHLTTNKRQVVLMANIYHVLRTFQVEKAINELTVGHIKSILNIQFQKDLRFPAVYYAISKLCEAGILTVLMGDQRTMSAFSLVSIKEHIPYKKIVDEPTDAQNQQNKSSYLYVHVCGLCSERFRDKKTMREHKRNKHSY